MGEQDDFVHGDSTTDEAQSHDCCKTDRKHKEKSQYVFLGAWKEKEQGPGGQSEA